MCTDGKGLRSRISSLGACRLYYSDRRKGVGEKGNQFAKAVTALETMVPLVSVFIAYKQSYICLVSGCEPTC